MNKPLAGLPRRRPGPGRLRHAELTAPQAGRLYELTTERAGKSLVPASSRAPAAWYPQCPVPSSPGRSARVIPTGNTSAN
jgi:hypothetical protein